MKYIKLLIIILFMFLITGCVSYSELNELGIIDMIIIDKKDDEYIVTVNMLLPKDDDLENKKTYTETNKSLNECLNDLYLSTTKKISFSHLELMALTPNIEKKDYDEIIDLFLNRVDSRNTFSTIIVDDTAKLLEYKTEDINDLININNEEDGTVSIKQFNDIIKDILEIDLTYVPRITIKDEIIIEGYQSIYHENKLLSKEESIGYNFITNKITGALFAVEKIGFNINNSRTNIRVNDNKIKMEIISSYQVMSNNSSIIDDKRIEKIYNAQIKEYINNYLDNNSHNYFYNLVKKYNYNYYKEHNNIKLEFDITMTSSKINNPNIKGGKFNE